MTPFRTMIPATAFVALLGVMGIWGLERAWDFHRPANGNVIKGGVARAFESHFDEVFPIKRLGVNLWGAFDYEVLREGKPGVVIGRDGWLFTDEEFDVSEDEATVVKENLERIDAAKAAFASAGIPLMIVIVPPKATIYAEHLGRRAVPSERIEMRRQLLAHLLQAGIPTVDLLPMLTAAKADAPMYFRTDTHWTPAGAKLAAEAVGHEVETLGLRSAQAQNYHTQKTGTGEHEGDLLSFLPLAPAFASWLPPMEPIDKFTTTPDSPAKPAGADDLFGDTAIPDVALVGTSYSKNPDWHFAAYLEAALGEPIANYAKEAVGPFPPMTAYLSGADLSAHKPHLVIWEMTERAIGLRPPQSKAADAGETSAKKS